MTTPIIVAICVALITSILGPIVVEYFKRLWSSSEKTKEDAMYKDIESSVLIDEQLHLLSEIIGADRIWVTQFHNGGHFYATGASIKKFSIFFEIVSVGIAKVQQQFQNTPTSFFSRSLKKLLDDHELHVEDMNNPDICTYGLKDQAQQTGCQSLFMVALTTPGGRFHGSLGVEFVKETHTFSEEEINEIRLAGTYISGLLSANH